MENDLRHAGDVAQSFYCVCRELTKFSQRNAESLGLTLSQMGLLNAVFASPGTTLKELTDKLKMPKSSASVAVDELVNMGMLERRIPEDNRREINLEATEKGKEAARISCGNASSYRAMANSLEKMPESDVREMLRIHGELLALLREQGDNE
jgi:DNA-binding MarR family transcriptional regulator